jgi:hypothetical protein
MIEVLKQAVEAFVVKQYAELESQEPMALPCCGYTDASAVKWNPLNGVVQCHNCGWNYSQRTWVGLASEDRLTAKYMQDAPDGIEAVIDYIETKLKELNT